MTLLTSRPAAGPAIPPAPDTDAYPWRPRVWAYRASATAVGTSLSMAAVAIAVPVSASLLKYLALVVAVIVGLVLAGRSNAEYLEYSLWLWALFPGLRRVIEWRTGYNENSLILVAPLAVSAISLFILARYPITGHRAVIRLMLRVSALVLYGAAVSVIMLRSPMAVGLGFLQLAVPLSLGMMALIAVRPGELARVLTRFSTGTLVVVGGYGIYQFVVAPPWDVQWLKDVSDVADSFGNPAPFEIRVFSTVNDPGSCSVVLIFGLLWLLCRQRISPWQVTALVIGGSCLSLTLVRSAWIALAIGIVLAVLRGWIKPERMLAITIALVFVASVSSTAVAPVIDRFNASRSAGGSDMSLQARMTFQSREFLPAITNLTGNGVGSAGTAVRRDDTTDTRFADTDSGFLETVRVFGGPLGIALIVGTLVACTAVFPRPSRTCRGAACFAMTIPVQLVFSSVYIDVVGVLFWMSLAAASRQSAAAAKSPD